MRMLVAFWLAAFPALAGETVVVTSGDSRRPAAAFVEESVREACRAGGLEEVRGSLRFVGDGEWAAADVENNSALLAPELAWWRTEPPEAGAATTYCLMHLVPDVVRPKSWPPARATRELLGFPYVFDAARGGFALAVDGETRPAGPARFVSRCCGDSRWGEAAFLETIVKSGDFERVIVDAETYLDGRRHPSVEAELHRELAIAFSTWWSLLNAPEDACAVPSRSFEKPGKGNWAKDADGVRRMSLRHFKRAIELRPQWREEVEPEMRALEEKRDTGSRTYSRC